MSERERTPDIDLIEDYFDAHAQNWLTPYETIERPNDVVLLQRRDIALDYLLDGLPPGGRVLDAGCGAGPLSLELAKHGYRVRGVDISKKLLALAELRLADYGIDPEHCVFEHGDLLALDLDPGSFDGIVALGFLQYQPDERKALDRFHELLRPGGVLVASGPMKIRLSNAFGLWDLYTAGKRRLARWMGSIGSQQQREVDLVRSISHNSYSSSRLRSLFQQSGFTTVELKRHGFVSFGPLGRWIGMKGELAMHRGFTGLARYIPIDRFANDLVAVAKRA